MVPTQHRSSGAGGVGTGQVISDQFDLMFAILSSILEETKMVVARLNLHSE